MSMLFAQVIVDILNSDVDRIFTYAVPDGMDIDVGAAVKVPFGRQKSVDGVVVSLTHQTELNVQAVKEIQSVVCNAAFSDEQLELARWIRKTYHTRYADAFRLFMPAQLRGTNAKYIQMLSLCISNDQAEEVLEGMRPGTKAYRIVSMLSEYGEMEKAQIIHEAGQCYDVIKQLCLKGIIQVRQEQRQRSPYLDIVPQKADFLTLTSKQQEVLDYINASSGVFKPILLHGVTGSGKTEVYMQAINNVIENKKTALVLVPEISLTPQMVLNFRKKLGNTVAIIHSALGAGERYDEWNRIATGEARVVIGARSAVFAPCKNIGIIIVDEEHETSYISETHPRYDAVEVALKRAEYNSCPCVLGSATPSVIRYYQAKQGKFSLLEMPQRANGQPLPKVEIIDMAREFSDGNRSMFSKKLYFGIADALQNQRQVMLFLNRRGYSSFVMCRACGETVRCEKCDVSLTYHSNVNKLRCHYCGYEIPLMKTCPCCGSPFIKQFGAGTQKVEEEFKRLFPNVNVVRMDNDTTKGKDAHFKILNKMATGEARVLIGTQMIAKGHDFPLVSLVGVIAADNMLRLPDYRSRERTFSLLTQVSGRAGRGHFSGKVAVQTYSPEHFVIKCAAEHDYKTFYQNEIEQRRQMWYPPFARFIRILYTSKDAQSSFSASAEAFNRVKQIQALNKNSFLLLQRSAAPIGRINDMYRNQLLIKLKEDSACAAITNEIYKCIEGIAQRELYCDIQVNPTNLF